MRRSKAEAAESRKRIVAAASALLREHGIDRASVADMMAAAGMTQGGFYKHFEDKESLVEEAVDAGSKEAVGRLRDAAERAPPGRVLSFITGAYLSAQHRADRARGCALAAHASEATRQGKGVRRAFTTGIYRMLDLLTDAAARDGKALRRQEALATLASLVGALMLSRATEDDALASEIVESVKARLEAEACAADRAK